MKNYFFLIGGISLLEASVNEPFRWEFFSGYRNDRIHWHLQAPGGDSADYSEIYRDVQFWENGLVVQGISRDIAFFAKGSYSAFGRGNLSQNYADLNFASNTTGWAADAAAYVSYAVNLTDGRFYKWILLPLIGYSAHFERLNRSTQSPDIGSSYEMISSFPQQLKQTWYGLFLGAGLQIEPGSDLIFNLGYYYHWLHTHFTTQWQELLSLQDGSTTTTIYSLQVSRGGNLGQTGTIQFDYRFLQAWTIGLGAQIHYFSTRFLKSSVKENGLSVAQTFKLRWTPIDGWLQISRKF